MTWECSACHQLFVRRATHLAKSPVCRQTMNIEERASQGDPYSTCWQFPPIMTNRPGGLDAVDPEELVLAIRRSRSAGQLVEPTAKHLRVDRAGWWTWWSIFPRCRASGNARLGGLRH